MLPFQGGIDSKQLEVDSKLVFPWPGPPHRLKGMDRIRDDLESREQKPVAEGLGTAKSSNEAGTWIQISIKKEALETTPASQQSPNDKYTFSSRYLSPDSTSDQSDKLGHPHSPQSDSKSHRIVGKNRQIITTSPTSVTEVPHILSPPIPSLSFRQAVPSGLSTASSVGVERQAGTKAPPKGKAKRSRGGRKGESRRIQNMEAQKKYRDKKLCAAELMSESIIQFQIALKGLETQSPEDCLDRIQYFMDEYRNDMEALDPVFLAKQYQAVNDQNF